MANRIRGITIEIDGNTTPLTKSLQGVDKQLKSTEGELKDVNKLLKLDPSNVTLLEQKQKLLGEQVKGTKTRLDELKKAFEQSKNSGNTAENQRQQDALQREIIETTAKLKDLEKQYSACSPRLEALSAKTGELSEKTRGLSTAAGLAAAGMIGLAVKAGQTADELLTDANVTGFTVEELQKLKYASDLVDVSYEAMIGSVTKLTKQMGSNAQVFSDLGVSIYNADGTMRSAVDVWYDAVEALGHVENSTERDTLSMELFGKSAMEMAGIVDDGGASLRSLGEEAEAAGLIMSGDAVENTGKFNDALDTLKAKASAAFASAGATLAETLIPMLGKLVDAVSKVLTWFANLDGTTQTVILTVLGLVAAISPVLGLISTLTALSAALNISMLPLTLTIGGIIAAIAALVAAGVYLAQNWEDIKAKAKAVWDAVKTSFEGLKQSVVDKWNSIKQKTSETWENVKGTVATVAVAVASTAATKFEEVKNSVIDKWNSLKNRASEIWNNIKSAITSPIESAKETISGIIEKIKGFFSFNFELPKIKLPHFGIQPPGWTFGDLLKGTIPRLGIEWYAKAMNGGAILDQPTIFGVNNNGQLMGGGEAGREVIVGANSLYSMIRAAVASRPVNNTGVTVSVVVNGNVDNYDALAETIGQKLQQQMAREGRALG